MPRKNPDGSRNYDYDKKFLKSHAEDNAARKRARRKLESAGKVKPFDGKDVHHVRGIKGGNGAGNLRAISKSKNRSMK